MDRREKERYRRELMEKFIASGCEDSETFMNLQISYRGIMGYLMKPYINALPYHDRDDFFSDRNDDTVEGCKEA